MRGRGCTLAVLGLMMVPLAASAQLYSDLPSGQSVTLTEILMDENPGALWTRFRFVAPDIARDGGSVSSELAALDMDVLCNDVAAPYLIQEAIDPERVVISLSDRAVEFGAPDPAATQFFETYRLEDARCIWEEF